MFKLGWITRSDEFPSSRDPNVKYAVKENADTGEWSCTCVGFKTHKKCKHIKEIQSADKLMSGQVSEPRTVIMSDKDYNELLVMQEKLKKEKITQKQYGRLYKHLATKYGFIGEERIQLLRSEA